MIPVTKDTVRLTRFSVAHAQNEHNGTIIHCFVGHEIVVAYLPRDALDDYLTGQSRHEIRYGLRFGSVISSLTATFLLSRVLFKENTDVASTVNPRG